MMGLREYARHRKALGLKGTTLGSVQKAIASGRIQVSGGKIDAAAADLAWVKTTDPALQRGAPAAETAPECLPILEGVVAQAPSALARRVEWDTPFPPLPPTPAGRGATEFGFGNVVDGDSFLKAKAERERAEAELAKLELAERRKEVIDAGEAARAFHSIGRMYSAAREGLPKQLAPRLVGLTDLLDIERRIKAALVDMDSRIAAEVRSRYADLVHRDVVAS